MADCAFFADEPGDVRAPYNFHRFNADGSSEQTPTMARDNATGLCYFPMATCSAPLLPAGEVCCDRSTWAEERPSFGWMTNVIVWPLFGNYVYFRCASCKRRFKERGDKSWSDEWGALGKKAAVGTPLMEAMGGLLLMATIVMQIQVVTQLNQQSQEKLSVQSRNGQMIAESVLSPIDDMFGFLDDILLVKVSIAIIANDMNQMRKTFILGSFGGFFCGILGASVATLMVISDASASSLLNPFSVSGTACSLLENPVGPTKVYFLFSAWAWPFMFANNAFQGYAMAMHDMFAFGLIGLTRILFHFLGIMIWFNGDPRIEVLGYLRCGQAVIGVLLWTVNFTMRPAVRAKIGFGSAANDQVAPASGPSGAAVGFWSDPTTKLALRDGLCAMFVELTVETARTFSLYAAAKVAGLGAFYQVSTHVAIQYGTGLAIAEGAFFNMKMEGSKLLSGGLNYHFVWLCEFIYAFCFFVWIGCTVAVYTSTSSMVFKNGQAMCIYASERDCLPEYYSYFGGVEATGESTMFETLITVPIVVAFRCFYRVSRSGLYAIQDFVWMLKVSSACFVLFFLPALAIYAATSKSALVAVLIMTIPNVSAGAAFAWRLWGHTVRLSSEDGNANNPASMRRSDSLKNTYGIEAKDTTGIELDPQVVVVGAQGADKDTA